MRNFIAYHNTQKMGRSVVDGDPLKVLSNKSLQHLHDHVVWIIQGDSGQSKAYSLASAFIVTEVGETGQDDFKSFARGDGHVFRPPIPIQHEPWFDELFKVIAHFSLGVCEVKLDRVIDGLIALAADSGWFVPGRILPPPYDDSMIPPISPEELKRRLRSGPGRPLAEILRDLQDRA